MASDIYFGTYARFDTASKKEASTILGADNLVGDIFKIDFVVKDGERRAWMKNKFDAPIGCFNEEMSRQLSLYEAKGWKLQALLSFIAYSETPEPGIYWGEAAIMCFNKKHEAAFDTFTERVKEKLMDGIRYDVALGTQGIQHVIDSEGHWTPKKLMSLPKLSAGTAFVKTKRSVTEKLVEQGRKGNKGCYFGSWIVLLALVALLLFGLKSCGVF